MAPNMASSMANDAESGSYYYSSPLVVTEIHSDTEAYVSAVYGIDGNLLTVATSPARAQLGAFLWVEMAVGNSRPVRILAEVISRNAEETVLRVKYLWPRHRAALIEMLAA